MRVYDIVKQILEDNIKTRDSDKYLIWNVWERQGIIKSNNISKENFIELSAHTETIRRNRQHIQQRYPKLRASKRARNVRREIQRQKGTHSFRETMFDLSRYNDREVS